MGYYMTEMNVEFKSNTDDEKKFKKLLALMNKDEDFDEEEFDSLPCGASDLVQHAVFGALEDRGVDSDYTCRFFPDFDLTLAPKLFAALFPDSCFSLELRYEYSAGGGETVFYAEYRNNRLLVRECQTEEDLEKLDEDLQNQFEEGELDIEELEDALLEVNGTRQIKPSRNTRYENSFFFDEKARDLGDDLMAYLGEE